VGEVLLGLGELLGLPPERGQLGLGRREPLHRLLALLQLILDHGDLLLQLGQLL